MRIPTKPRASRITPIRHVKIDKPILIPRLPVITNDKQRVKLVKQIETYIRQSMEYKDLIKYLHQNVHMDECAFLQNFKSGKRRGMIEIHHAPFTLFSIVDIVMTKQEKQLGYIDEFDVADEVMRLHYKGLVGLVPLSVTCHQLVHDNQLSIPLWCVYGRFVEFTKLYYDWIPDEVHLALKEQLDLSRKFKRNPKLLEEHNSILNVNYVYLDVEGELPMEDGLSPEEHRNRA